jgi:hypothetical protein
MFQVSRFIEPAFNKGKLVTRGGNPVFFGFLCPSIYALYRLLKTHVNLMFFLVHSNNITPGLKKNCSNGIYIIIITIKKNQLNSLKTFK